MYLVVVSGAFDDVPVRLFGGLKKAKAYAKSNWDSVENEASEDLYKDAWEASKSANLPAITEIAGVRVLRFRDGVMVGCVCNISGRVTSGNVD
jgi:hypothetical protein